MRRLCAVCAEVPAAIRADLDGREIWVCRGAGCGGEVADPGVVVVDPLVHPVRGKRPTDLWRGRGLPRKAA